MRKRPIWIFAIFLAASSLFAQGELFFSTRNTVAGVNAPVYITDSRGALVGPGPAYSAGLFVNNVLEPSSLTVFQAAGSGGAAILDRYVVPVTVQFANHPVGSSITFDMRIWPTSAGSYANAASAGGFDWGQSGPLTITLGGSTLPPADLPSSFTGFAIFPEPSTFVLAGVGLSLLLFLRKR